MLIRSSLRKRKYCIIDPVDREKLISELTPEKFVRFTNKGKNEIYVFNYHSAPNLMREVARLREVSFRAAGGGTGDPLDIDVFDIQPAAYSQLIVWNPEKNDIIGGYRFANAYDIADRGNRLSSLAINKSFELSSNFIINYLPYSIELGRAFVQPKYQSTNNVSNSIYALDNLWDGLGALINKYPEKKYFYGKVTLYQNFDEQAKSLLLNYLHNHFEDYSIMKPRFPLNYGFSRSIMENRSSLTSVIDEYKMLVNLFRKQEIIIPPLFNSYISLSPTLKVFGTFHDPDFGKVDETGIMITIADIYPKKIERHLKSFRNKPEFEESVTARVIS
jgi:hypothetical protein